MTTYLLDANVFIEAKNGHYAFEIVPAFWTWLDQAHAEGIVLTVAAVYDELVSRDDDLSDWIKARPKSFFEPVFPEDQPSQTDLAVWAANGQYRQAAVAEFLSKADFYLVAQARTHGFTVVTHERPAPMAERRIKIPDACDAMGVEWMSPFQMLRAENVQFGTIVS